MPPTQLAMLLILLFAASALAEPQPSAATVAKGALRPPRLAITARIYGTSDAKERMLPSAMREAAKLLAPAGVDLVIQRCETWRSGDESNPCARPLALTEFAVRTYRSSSQNGEAAEQRLGYSFIDWRTGGGSLVTLDLTAIDWLAAASRTSARALLARAAAHEIGHLLLGSGDHSAEGLMRGLWSSRSLRRQQRSDWQFTEPQIAEIHDRSLRPRSAERFAAAPLLGDVVKSTN